MGIKDSMVGLNRAGVSNAKHDLVYVLDVNGEYCGFLPFGVCLFVPSSSIISMYPSMLVFVLEVCG